jgi:hypothetical protein
MASWLRNALLAVLVVGLTWSGAVVYWRNSVNGPSPVDLVLVMLGLPLLLLGGLWYGRRLMTPSPSPAAPAPAQQPAAPAPAAQAPSMAVIATSLRMPHASSAAELSGRLERGNARASLDPELVGDDGYPIMSARAAAADDADAREQVSAWIERHGGNPDQLYEEQLRGLLLAGAVAQELGAVAADECIPPGQAAPALQLALLAPPNWNGDLRRIALDYLRAAVIGAGWPEGAVTAHIVEEACAVLPGGARHAACTLLVAAASYVGDYTVNEWSADLTLFSAAHQQGLIPGEAAAGLLLSSAQGDGHARVSGAAAMRDSSADSERRPDSRVLAALVKRTLGDAGVAVDSIAAVTADTGHRTGRLMEVSGLLRDVLPHLDAGIDLRATGIASGSCADAGFIAALALAAEQARVLGAPVLCVANEDPFRRTALIVQP